MTRIGFKNRIHCTLSGASDLPFGADLRMDGKKEYTFANVRLSMQKFAAIGALLTFVLFWVIADHVSAENPADILRFFGAAMAAAVFWLMVSKGKKG